MMVMVVDPACIQCRFNVGGLLWLWKVEELLLKKASEFGMGRGFSQYSNIGGSVLERQFITTARHCIRSIVVGVGHGLTDRAASLPNLAPLCPAPIRYGNRDRLGKMVLHFRSGLAARGVLTDVDFEKLVPE